MGNHSSVLNLYDDMNLVHHSALHCWLPSLQELIAESHALFIQLICLFNSLPSDAYMRQ